MVINGDEWWLMVMNLPNWLPSMAKSQEFTGAPHRVTHPRCLQTWDAPPGILEMIAPMPCWCLAPQRTTCSAADDHGWPIFFQLGITVVCLKMMRVFPPNFMGFVITKSQPKWQISFRYGWKLSVPQVDGLVLKMTNQFGVSIALHFFSQRQITCRAFLMSCVNFVSSSEHPCHHLESSLIIVLAQWFSTIRDRYFVAHPAFSVPIDIIRYTFISPDTLNEVPPNYHHPTLPLSVKGGRSTRRPSFFVGWYLSLQDIFPNLSCQPVAARGPSWWAPAASSSESCWVSSRRCVDRTGWPLIKKRSGKKACTKRRIERRDSGAYMFDYVWICLYVGCYILLCFFNDSSLFSMFLVFFGRDSEERLMWRVDCPGPNMRNSGVQEFCFSTLARSASLMNVDLRHSKMMLVFQAKKEKSETLANMLADVGEKPLNPRCWRKTAHLFRRQVLNEVAFKVLRTELQLGYVARGTQWSLEIGKTILWTAPWKFAKVAKVC